MFRPRDQYRRQITIRNPLVEFRSLLGLIPEQLRRTLIVTGIDASAATCMNARGKFEQFRCMNLDHPPWWDDPRFIPSKPVEREWHSTRGTRPTKG